MRISDFIKHFTVFLSAFLVAFTSVYIVLITFCDIPKENMPFVNTVLGFLLGTVVGTVVTYYLGSSKGSADKNKIIDTPSKQEI